MTNNDLLIHLRHQPATYVASNYSPGFSTQLAANLSLKFPEISVVGSYRVERATLVEDEQSSVPRNVILMSIGNTITTSANSLWIMFMPYFFADVGIAPFFIGMIFTAITVSRAMASLIGGKVADRFGRKPVISIGFLMYACGILVILASLIFVSSTPSLSGFISAIGYMWMAAGGGFLGPASSMLLIGAILL